jgi:membrane-bound lytic murein transglycosylase MltF
MRGRCIFVLTLLIGCLAISGCGSKAQAPPPTHSAAKTAPKATLEITDSTTSDHALYLPPTFGRWTGDWNALVKRGVLRLLVVYSKAGFFYDKGRPRGIMAEAAEQLELAINKRLHTHPHKFKVAVIPVAPGQLLEALNGGIGDVIATSVVVSREREALVDFTVPLYSGAKGILVTNKNGPAITGLDDLGGRAIYVPKISVGYGVLRELSRKRKADRKQEIAIREAAPNLTEEDLLEMTNAGVIPATIALDFRAKLWSVVLPNIVIHPDIVLKDNGDIAWAMRKNSPELKAVLDDFVKEHRQGTMFGNMMIQRYLKSAKFITNSTSATELRKFQAYVGYFQKYATHYNFDYLMLGALGYQESMLQQEKVSPRGAVGIMQVLPKYAAADPINISNVRNADANIHAGTKMLAQIANTYFNDPGITPMNKTLFTFAAYNAGPNRIARLRKQAEREGFDPNRWFGNVEFVVAKDVGQETVQYVSNIYKYYVAYKMTVEQAQLRKKAQREHNGK